MSKAETLRRLAEQSNEKRLEHLGTQIEALRQTKIQNAEELAQIVEPLAQAMAALTDEARQNILALNEQSLETELKLRSQMVYAMRAYEEATKDARKAAEEMKKAGELLEWKHYAQTVLVGVFSAVLVSVFWIWRAPTPQLTLDPKEIAELLKPAVIEASRPSRSR